MRAARLLPLLETRCAPTGGRTPLPEIGSGLPERGVCRPLAVHIHPSISPSQSEACLSVAHANLSPSTARLWRHGRSVQGSSLIEL